MPEMQSAKLSGSKPSESTQRYLDIQEVREGVMILKDGGLRAVIAVSSTNFSLKSEDEQNALTSSYQSFLNSLEFPVQIVVQSRILDIDSYLEKLRVLASGQSNELLRIQMNEYIEFVGKLVEFASIMSKTFYVVVPYSTEVSSGGFMSKLKGLINPVGKISARQEDFERNRTKLEERVMHVTGKLGGMGLRSVALKTEEVVELLYNSYNFDSASPISGQSLEAIELEE